MGYFEGAKKGDKVYGLVPYTEDGIPGWGNFKNQTLFYADDVDLGDADFTPVEKVLSAKKIIKQRENGKLEVRLPSGKWENVKRCPERYIETLLENEQYHLFRKKQ